VSIDALHAWDLEPEAAMRAQTELRQRLMLAWDGRPVASVAGVDVSLPGDLAWAAIVVLSFPAL
jgi:deoxyribonuclease V